MAVNIKHLGYLSTRNHPSPIRHTKRHIKYIEANTKEHRNQVSLFDKESDQVDRREFFAKIPQDGVVAHKLVFSLSEDEQKKKQIDMQELTREIMKGYEEKNKGTLQWVAALHDDEGHPHVHIVILGRNEEGKSVGIRRKNLDQFRDIAERTRVRLAERQRGQNQDRDLFEELERDLELVPAPEKEREKKYERELTR